MNLFILIVGGGKVGTNLAHALTSQGYEIALVEQDRRKIERLERDFDYAVVQGDGTEIAVLEKAGIARADYVIAVTGDDEDNIIIAQLAVRKYGVQNIIARVNNPRNQPTFDLLGVRPTVSSVASILGLVEHRLPHHQLLNLLSFEEENVRMVELVLSERSRARGHRLSELQLPSGILLVLIFRGDGVIIPHGDVDLMADDRLVFIMERGRDDDLLEVLGRDTDSRDFYMT